MQCELAPSECQATATRACNAGPGLSALQQAEVSDESALIYLASLGLEIHDAKTFFDMLAGVAADKYIDIETFVKGCLSGSVGILGLL